MKHGFKGLKSPELISITFSSPFFFHYGNLTLRRELKTRLISPGCHSIFNQDIAEIFPGHFEDKTDFVYRQADKPTLHCWAVMVPVLNLQLHLNVYLQELSLFYSCLHKINQASCLHGLRRVLVQRYSALGNFQPVYGIGGYPSTREIWIATDF